MKRTSIAAGGPPRTIANRGKTVPLYNARVRDLGADDCVRIVCFTCKSETLVPVNALLRWAHVLAETPILDLERRVRCRACGAMAEALVSVVWGGGNQKKEENA